MLEVRVIGVPRSGTNLAKYLIETCTDVRCYFNHGWWKHRIIPPLTDRQHVTFGKIPTIIMFREPLRQIASFYKFARKGRTAMSGASDFLTFISSPIRMKPGSGSIEYHFSTPIEYWIQFHHAAIHWHSGNRFFIDLQDLQENPRIIVAVLSQIFPQTRPIIDPQLPERYLGRNPNRHASKGWKFETGTTLEKENRQALSLLASLSSDEVAGMLTSRTTALYERLRGARSPKAVDACSANRNGAADMPAAFTA